MSAWIEVVGWCLIALGAWSVLRTSRTVARLYRLGKCQVIEPGLRRKAWRNTALAPHSFVWGVFWVSTRWIHDALLWLPIAYLVVLVLGIVGMWFRFRSNDGQAAG
jgi:hypothetical protein